ncbi:MAG: hypothetical protein AB7L90_00155 [Hyphomicrobiaceae bacterium]
MAGHAYTRPATPALHSPAAHFSAAHSDEFRDHTDFLRWELAVDERVGRPLARRRRWPRWLAAVSLCLAGGGWAMIDDKPAAQDWLKSQFAAGIDFARTLIPETGVAPAVPAALPPLALPHLRLIEPTMLQAAKPAAAGVLQASATGNVPAVSESTNIAVERLNSEPASESEPTPAVEPERPAPLPPLPPLTDPLQKKAEAAGLHPELSRALLQSLSATDFKNAAVAIKKAIAETPDDGVLLWPPKPSRGAARFRIHFVPGISPSCRRYVVGVGKTGWLTTALPMERCGVKPRLARSQPAPRDVFSGAQNP